jgi:2-polyprenyl-6-methoxyphenol hydroxylase-like FAD-dependent oxidoreductase
MIADVLIVGGGPAGLATALALRQRGASVMVADAMGPSIDKVCGEGLMPDSRRELGQLGVELDASEGAEFHGIRFVDGTGRRRRGDKPPAFVTAPFPAGVGIGVRRTILHRRMVERAQETGATIRWRSHVQLQPDGTVRIAGETVRYGWLVGADGQSSRVRRWAGLESGRLMSRRFAFRQHFAVEPWSSYAEVHWGRSCQIYVAPVATDAVCVASMSRNPRLRLADALAELPWLAAKLRGAKLVRSALDSERGSVLTTRRLRHVARGRVALVGDASASVDPITGEGMAMGFRQALLLAECLSNSESDLAMTRYARFHPQVLLVPQTMARAMLLMDRFPGLRDRALGALVAKPALFDRMLSVHLGAESMARFVMHKGLELVWRLALPPARAEAGILS